jgi:radical SAM protein (TIGR01212 family)
MNFPITLKSRWHGKRFNSFNRALRDQFNSRVYKIGLRQDFTCPNRDGKVAVGGCIYCNNAGHTPQVYRPHTSVTAQLEQGAAALAKRHKAEKFIAYFQSYTNTYDSVAKLEKLYREAIDFPGVVGISIATRPDCVADDVLDLLTDLDQQTYLWLELGLESMYERTLAWVNRGHGLREYLDAVNRAKARDLRVCTHLILGFPGESRNDILATAGMFNRLAIDGVKLHNLHVIKNTQLEKYYQLGQVPIFSRGAYIDLMIDFLERLDPQIVMHRLSGDANRAITVAPEWSVDKRGVHNAIVKALEEKDAWQGRLFSANIETRTNDLSFTDLQGASL